MTLRGAGLHGTGAPRRGGGEKQQCGDVDEIDGAGQIVVWDDDDLADERAAHEALADAVLVIPDGGWNLLTRFVQPGGRNSLKACRGDVGNRAALPACRCATTGGLKPVAGVGQVVLPAW